jgi:hypothetical protein
MKTLMNRMAPIATGAVVLGISAFGNTSIMKTEIPFTLRTSHAGFAESVDAANGREMATLQNELSKRQTQQDAELRIFLGPIHLPCWLELPSHVCRDVPRPLVRTTTHARG